MIISLTSSSFFHLKNRFKPSSIKK